MAETAHRQSRWARIYPRHPTFTRTPTLESSEKSASEPEREKLVTKLLRACPLTLAIPSVLKTIEEERAKRKAAAELRPPKSKSSWTSRLGTARTTRANTRRTSPVDTARTSRVGTARTTQATIGRTSPVETAGPTRANTARTTRVNSRQSSPVNPARSPRANTRGSSPVHRNRTSWANITRIAQSSTVRNSRGNTRRASPVEAGRNTQTSTARTTRTNTRQASPIDTARTLRTYTREASPSDTTGDSWTGLPRISRPSTTRNSRRNSRANSRRSSPVDVRRASRANSRRNSRFNTRRRNSPVNFNRSSIAFEVFDPEDLGGSAVGQRVSTVTVVRMSAVDRLRSDNSSSRSRSRTPSRPGSVVGGPVSGMIHRPSLVESVRTASNNSNANNGSPGSGASQGLGYGHEKPLVSGNGVSLSINLAEPVLFLQGFDQSELANQNTSMLRGSFHLRVSKTAKIKTVSLKFSGRAETEWPEGEYMCRAKGTFDPH